jgi:hexosaminidase
MDRGSTASAGDAHRSTPLPVVPAPLHAEVGPGRPFVVAAGTRVVAGDSPDEISAAVLTADLLGAVLDVPLGLGTEGAGRPGTIAVLLDPSAGPLDQDPAERYTLVATTGGVEVRAPRPAGLLRGAATLRQLLVRQPSGVVTVPAVTIHDAPRYPWRGLSIDVARHFFDVEAVCAVLSAMAQLKLNVLHLHLTDDQGWRLDLPSRPRLAERSSAQEVGDGPGGCYSVEEYGRIVAHAAARHIAVVPEVDVPGHVNAALHAYPELTPTGVAPPPYTGIDVGFSRLHRELPATEPFLRDVFGDLAALTPGEYLHVGGDEVLTMAPDEYAWFVRTVQDVVRAAGKQVVGWEEVAHADVDPGTVVQVWKPADAGADVAPVVAAARRGARVLLSPADHVYLDMKYDPTTDLGLEWAGHVELRDAYAWDPDAVVPGLPPESVIGVEAAVWGETLRSPDDLFVMLLPRLAAVAEVAWTAPDLRDWPGFRRRVAGLADGWDRDGFLWYPSPQVDW